MTELAERLIEASIDRATADARHEIRQKALSIAIHLVPGSGISDVQGGFEIILPKSANLTKSREIYNRISRTVKAHKVDYIRRPTSYATGSIVVEFPTRY